jgi:hypothetical protein
MYMYVHIYGDYSILRRYEDTIKLCVFEFVCVCIYVCMRRRTHTHTFSVHTCHRVDIRTFMCIHAVNADHQPKQVMRYDIFGVFWVCECNKINTVLWDKAYTALTAYAATAQRDECCSIRSIQHAHNHEHLRKVIRLEKSSL